ncbi:MAG: hypothetical protein M3071_17905, partial [Actinomycetota bacterium]|nr:hypothetical protein [Actinomycetota bacterium]
VVTPTAPVVTPAPVVVPPAPVIASAPGVKLTRKAAIAACSSKYNTKKAKSRRAKHLMARRRMACIARAQAATNAAVATAHTVDVVLMSATSRPSLIANFVHR